MSNEGAQQIAVYSLISMLSGGLIGMIFAFMGAKALWCVMAAGAIAILTFLLLCISASGSEGE